MNFCYFCNHPYPLVIFNAIAQIAKTAGLNVRHQLIFSKHRYFLDLDYEQFMETFDEVQEISYVETRRNFFVGLGDARKYIRSLESVRIREDSTFFTISYSDLATNLFCAHVKRVIPKAELVHFTIYGNFLDVSSGRFSLCKTIQDSVYSILLGARFLSTYVDDQGTVLERIYWHDPHTKIFQLAFSSHQKAWSFPRIPFPLISTSTPHKPSAQRAVLFFGDGTLESYYPELDRNILFGTVNRTLRFLRDRYKDHKDVKIFYKPHPLDRGSVPAEVNLDGIEVYRDRLSAEMILLQSDMEVLEAYTISSTACLTASHYGIPSFALFRICGFPGYAVNRFAGHFKTANSECFVDVQSWEHLETTEMKKVIVDGASIRDTWVKVLRELMKEQCAFADGSSIY